MKTIKKNSITVLGLSLAAAIFFSCSNPVPLILPENPATEETGTNSATPESAAGGAGTGTSSGAASGGGASGAAGYIEPTLPASVGTDPFAGRTYRNEQSGTSGGQQFSMYTEYAFGTDGILTYTQGETVGSSNSQSGTKWQYTYNATTKVLSLKQTHMYQTDTNGVYAWRDYNQLVDYLNSLNYADYLNQMNQNGQQAISESEFNQAIQTNIDNLGPQFSRVTIYKAEENYFKNLKLRTDYHTTAPSGLPCNEYLQLYYQLNTSNQNRSINLSVSPSNQNSSSKGRIWTTSWTSGGNSSTTTDFNITNITSNTITAKESTYTSGVGYTLVDNGQQLQLSYSNLALGNDNNVVLTLSGADSSTNTYLNSIFNTTSITLSTFTTSQSYVWQDNGAATAPALNTPTLTAGDTCPFAGHTYSSSSHSYSFGNDGTLTYSYTYNGSQTGGTKWQYSYNATSHELSLKTTHIWMSFNNQYGWRTYNDIYNYYRTSTYENAEASVNSYKTNFETLTYYKATANGSNLNLRTDNYYNTHNAPSSLPATKSISFSSGNNISGKRVNININAQGQGNLNNRGTFSIYTYGTQGSSDTTTYFVITNIASNTITAAAATLSNGQYTLVTNGQQLQFTYSTPTLGTNNTLALTITGANSGTNSYFTTQFSSNSINLSTSTSANTYTLQS